MKRSIRDQQYIDRLKARLAEQERRITLKHKLIHMLENEVNRLGGNSWEIRFQFVDWIEAQRAKEEGKTA